VFKRAIERKPKEMEVVLRGMENETMLKTLPLVDEIANTAVFLASDLAKSITGVTIDVTGGTPAGLNYRAGSMPIEGQGPARCDAGALSLTDRIQMKGNTEGEWRKGSEPFVSFAKSLDPESYRD